VVVLKLQSNTRAVVRHVVTFVNSVYTIKIIIVWAIMYVTYCYFFHVRPANQPTIVDVALWYKKVARPCFEA